mmetsp:Transcript_101688/g.175568  ORF Transcript_101688/g.175568 Transcript_101688/m.175568 type:complete len:94 (+) Transcript_101688:201-482(+)
MCSMKPPGGLGLGGATVTNKYRTLRVPTADPRGYAANSSAIIQISHTTDVVQPASGDWKRPQVGGEGTKGAWATRALESLPGQSAEPHRLDER